MLQARFDQAASISNWTYGHAGATFDTAGTRKAATVLQQWSDKGYFEDGFNGVSQENAAARFGKGEGLYFITGPWENQTFAGPLGDGVGFFPLPSLDGTPGAPTTGALSLPFHISSHSQNQAVAAAFIDFITDRERGQDRDRQRRPAGREPGGGGGRSRLVAGGDLGRLGREGQGGHAHAVPGLDHAHDRRHPVRRAAAAEREPRDAGRLRGGRPAGLGEDTFVRPACRVSRGAVARRRGRVQPAPGEPRLIGYLYVLPALVVFGVFVVAPMIDGAWISLFAWDGVTVGHWVGLSNYREALVDPLVREAFAHSLVLVGFYAVLPITIGLLLTALMSHARVRGWPLVRTIIFLPQVLAVVVVGVAWKWLYDPSGPINTLLGAVGLSSLEHSWLGDFSTALPAVGVIGTWVTTGLCLVLFVAGVQRIPLSRYEAARVDGAGAGARVLRGHAAGPAQRAGGGDVAERDHRAARFDIIFVTTKGGPGNATTVPSLLIYQRAFDHRRGGICGRDRGDAWRAIILLLSRRDHPGGGGAAVNTAQLRAHRDPRHAGPVLGDRAGPAGGRGADGDAPLRSAPVRRRAARLAQPGHVPHGLERGRLRPAD